MPVIALPAPVGGLNARDALTAMEPTDAIRLIGMVPKGTYVESEPEIESGFGTSQNDTPPHTLIAYENGATLRLIIGRKITGAASPIANPDIAVVDTTTGAITSLKTLTSDNVFGHTMFQTRAIICNGVDTPQIYNGTVCADIVATGPTVTELRGCFTFKGRVYYWRDNDLAFWYAAAGAFQGTLTEYRFDTFASRGGKVSTICSLTRDGGEGADDLFIVALSTGEILAFQGDDPASASGWNLIGRFYCPRPLGLKAAAKVGVTTYLLTTDGVIDVGALLSGSPDYFVSSKVQGLAKFSVSDATEIVDYPQTNSIVIVGATNYGSYYLGSLDRPLSRKKDDGAWWQSNTAKLAIAGCNLAGLFYFSSVQLTPPVFTCRISRVSSYGGTFTAAPTQSWRSIGKAGSAFAPIFPTTVNVDYEQDTTNTVIGAYVQPFSGLIGQVTAIQFVYVISTSGSLYRWLKTSLRIKGGGNR